MSTEDNGLEYYLSIDNVKHTISIMKYVFNIFYPNGEEQKVISLNYGGKSGYTYKECKRLCERLLTMLETTNWKRENNVY
jgi:hypothetical protein